MYSWFQPDEMTEYMLLFPRIILKKKRNENINFTLMQQLENC